MCAPHFTEAGGLAHGFTTRLGGVSCGAYASLNIGIRRPDDKEHIMENLRRSVRAVGGTFENLVISHQTHGTVIRKITRNEAGEGARGETDTPEADALMTNEADIPLLTYYADCVPVALYDPKKRVIAVVHAGWRGTVSGIAALTAEAMCLEYGCAPQDILAAIGASIGKCCFEIGEDIKDAFLPEFLSPSPLRKDKFFADLWQYNAYHLKRAGVPEENIILSGECTKCRNDKYFSNRAQGGVMGNHGLIMELKDEN